jgi:hypothetical protein
MSSMARVSALAVLLALGATSCAAAVGPPAGDIYGAVGTGPTTAGSAAGSRRRLLQRRLAGSSSPDPTPSVNTQGQVVGSFAASENVTQVASGDALVAAVQHGVKYIVVTQHLQLDGTWTGLSPSDDLYVQARTCAPRAWNAPPAWHVAAARQQHAFWHGTRCRHPAMLTAHTAMQGACGGAGPAAAVLPTGASASGEQCVISLDSPDASFLDVANKYAYLADLTLTRPAGAKAASAPLLSVHGGSLVLNGTVLAQHSGAASALLAESSQLLFEGAHAIEVVLKLVARTAGACLCAPAVATQSTCWQRM